MASNQEIIVISNRIVGWLLGKTRELEKVSNNITFKQIRDIFLQGNTLIESVGCVISFEEIIRKQEVGLNFTIIFGKNKSFFDSLPHPSNETLLIASVYLDEMGVKEKDIQTSDIYLENPSKSNKELLTFVLGE